MRTKIEMAEPQRNAVSVRGSTAVPLQQGRPIKPGGLENAILSEQSHGMELKEI